MSEFKRCHDVLAAASALHNMLQAQLCRITMLKAPLRTFECIIGCLSDVESILYACEQNSPHWRAQAGIAFRTRDLCQEDLSKCFRAVPDYQTTHEVRQLRAQAIHLYTLLDRLLPAG